MIQRLAVALLVGALPLPAFAAPQQGYPAQVTVSGPTRLDWTFAASNRSLVKPTVEMLEESFNSSKQSYELYVPVRKESKKPLPAILFISASDDPSGWKSFE